MAHDIIEILNRDFNKIYLKKTLIHKYLHIIITNELSILKQFNGLNVFIFSFKKNEIH